MRHWADIDQLVHNSTELVANTHENTNVCVDKLGRALRDKQVTPGEMVQMIVVLIQDKLGAK